MKLEATKIKEIYNGNIVKHYDLPISHMFMKYKKQAFVNTSLKKGDKVLVFCCGTGLDFPFIMDKIGKEGKIVGVDFSHKMLKKAHKRIGKNNWKNIELVEADVTKYKVHENDLYDAAVCTLGLSIIPEYQIAYCNLISAVKESGEIIIGDMQLASNRYAKFNPLTIFMAKKFGGSYEGHKNSLQIFELMKKNLKKVYKNEFFLGAYYFAIGYK
ncbi:MAG: hypothetical protein C0597_03545 [Marinilabiliales bacterium]|nr:MAG: hypothetical protein C0597_03545 [Marinilabiliales bacterium]